MKAYYYNNFNTGSGKQIVIINENQIVTKKLCETYDDYGHECGCYNAGCYAINNYDSDFIEDLKKAISVKFGELPAYDVNSSTPDSGYIVWDDDVDDEELTNVDREAINVFLNEWVEENTKHPEVTVFEYHDGSNWHSLAMSVEGTDPALEEIEEELNAEIVNEYISGHRTEFVQGKMVFETEHFIFTLTQFASDWTIANVDKK